MKRIFLLLILSIFIYSNSTSQSTLIVGAGGGAVYGINESPTRDVNGAVRINAVLTNAFGSFLSPELGINFLKLSSKEASIFETSITNVDLGLRWYLFEMGDWKPYIYGGIGIGGYNSKYNYWHSEFTTKDGADVDKINGTGYSSPNETVRWGKNYSEVRQQLINEAGGRDAYYFNSDRNKLNGTEKGTTWFIPIGAGISYQATRDLSFNLAVYNYLSTTDAINPYIDDVNDSFWSGLITVNYNVGNIFGNGDDEDDQPFPNFIVGTSLNLQNVTFETGSSNLNKESYKILRRAFSTMNENPSLEVKIIGHTDDVGDATKNMALSQERAEVVKKWLVDKGISPSRITTEGVGSNRPLLPNDSPANRAQNRRIEFIRTR